MFAKILFMLTFFALAPFTAEAQSFDTITPPKKQNFSIKTPTIPSAPVIATKEEPKVPNTAEAPAPLPVIPPISITPEQKFQAQKPLLDNIDFSARNYRPEDKKELVRLLNNLEKREHRRLQNIAPEKAIDAPTGQNKVDVNNVDDFKDLLKQKFLAPDPILSNPNQPIQE